MPAASRAARAANLAPGPAVDEPPPVSVNGATGSCMSACRAATEPNGEAHDEPAADRRAPPPDRQCRDRAGMQQYISPARFGEHRARVEPALSWQRPCDMAPDRINRLGEGRGAHP